jgi:hypothetical protein
MRTYKCTNCGKENKWGYSHGNKYCNNVCQKQYERKERVRAWLTEGKDWKLSVPVWAKDYLAEQRGYACECCGISEWQGKTIVLEVDHIDGDHKNNHPTNLRLICPNCHSQTDTYKAKNTGNGRKHRRKV